MPSQRFRFAAQERATDADAQERMPWVPMSQLEGYLLARGGVMRIARIRLCDTLRPTTLLRGVLAEDLELSLLTPEDAALVADAMEVVLQSPHQPGRSRRSARAHDRGPR